MNIKKNILKILALALWIVLGSGVLVLLVAAMNVKNHKTCKGLEIEIAGVEDMFFLDRKEVEEIITNNTGLPEGKPVEQFNLQLLEGLLERNTWVKDAQLFFDNNLMLHVNIVEREPVARIFTVNGSSFYIDSSGFRLPLKKNMTVKLPVFTGFPGEGFRLTKADSMLMTDVKQVGRYILKDSFWMAQIAQVDIMPDKTFEMIPTVGGQTIEFGDGENYIDKFKRLSIFYKQVLSKTGLEKYSRIKLQYDRQVVAVNKGTDTKVDSIQALKNIQQMIKDAMKVAEDTVFTSVDNIAVESKKGDSTLTVFRKSNTGTSGKTALPISTSKSTVPRAEKLIRVHHPSKKPVIPVTGLKQKPKAVMQRAPGW